MLRLGAATPAVRIARPPAGGEERMTSAPDIVAQFARACGVAQGLRLKVETAGRSPSEHALRAPCAVIGAAESSGLWLGDPDVADRHAFVLLLGGRLYACDLGTSPGTFREQDRFQRAWFEYGESIRIGQTRITACPADPKNGRAETLPAAAAAVPLVGSSPDVELIFQRRRGPQVYRIRRDVVLIGSAACCKVQFKHARVAAVHSALVCTPEGPWIVDLNTPEGTLLDDAPVRLAPLTDGSRLRFGETDVDVRWLLPTAAAAPAAPPVPASGHESMALKMMEEFRASQRELLEEMRGWMQEFSRSLLENQRIEAREARLEHRRMREEFLAALRFMARPGAAAGPQAVPREPAFLQPAAPAATAAAANVDRPDPDRTSPRPALATVEQQDELRRRIQMINDQLDEDDRGWLSRMLNRKPR